jgi:ketosteroid isomerase-like protein
MRPVLPPNALPRSERAMSEESTTPPPGELFRRALDATNCRDFDAVASLYAPDAVYRGTEIGAFEGAAAIRGFFEDYVGCFEAFEVVQEEILDLGNGVVFAVVVQKGRPVGSSGEVRLRYASVTVWTEGLIEWITDYMDIDEARAAAERLAEDRADV